MPFFEYSATDQSGKRVSGKVQSADSNAAREALIQAGLRTVDVFAAKSASPPQAAPAAPPKAPPRRAVVSMPVQPAPPLTRNQPLPPTRGAKPPAGAGGTTPIPVVKTRPGNDKQLFFILTQLAGMQSAGIAPSSFLEHLANRASKLYKDSLIYAAARVGEGARLSDCLARYPNLYPSYVIGHIRVGEESGYFAEAVEMATDSLHRSSRLRGRLSYFPIMAGIMLVIVPLSLGVIRGSLDTMKAQDKAGGSLPPVQALMDHVTQSMKTYGPIALAVILALYGLSMFWRQPFMRETRHRLGLFLFPARSRFEAVTRLSWALGRATKAAIPYYTAFQLAAQCIPNEVLRRQVMAEAAQAREGEPLSLALRRSRILPPHYADVVETGEMTGDVPKAMEQLSKQADTDFEHRDKGAVGCGILIFYVLLSLMTLVLVVILVKAFYGGLMDWMTSDEFMG